MCYVTTTHVTNNSISKKNYSKFKTIFANLAIEVVQICKKKKVFKAFFIEYGRGDIFFRVRKKGVT